MDQGDVLNSGESGGLGIDRAMAVVIPRASPHFDLLHAANTHVCAHTYSSVPLEIQSRRCSSSSSATARCPVVARSLRVLPTQRSAHHSSFKFDRLRRQFCHAGNEPLQQGSHHHRKFPCRAKMKTQASCDDNERQCDDIQKLPGWPDTGEVKLA